MHRDLEALADCNAGLPAYAAQDIVTLRRVDPAINNQHTYGSDFQHWMEKQKGQKHLHVGHVRWLNIGSHWIHVDVAGGSMKSVCSTTGLDAYSPSLTMK